MRLINPLKLIFYAVGILRGIKIYRFVQKMHPEISVILNEGSFGHTITVLDILSRGYDPHKINVIVIQTELFNDYLKEIFSVNINYVEYNPIAKKLKFNNHYQIIEGMGVKFVVGALGSLKPSLQYIPHGSLVYRFYNFSKIIPKFFSEKDGRLVPFNTFINHKDLIRLSPSHKRKLNKDNVDLINKKIISKSGDGYSGIISLLIRKKQSFYSNQHDKLRDCDDEEKYVDIAKYFSNKGYVVLISGDTDYNLFSGINNIYDFNILGVNAQLLNIFCLSESSLVICQHSGPIHLANTCNVPLVISDALPFWQGSANNNDLIVHKRLYDYKLSKYLSYKEIKDQYLSLLYGDYDVINSPNLKIQDSLNTDIIAAAEEILERKQNSKLSDAENELISQYFEVIPQDTLAYIRKTRPPIRVLERDLTSN